MLPFLFLIFILPVAMVAYQLGSYLRGSSHNPDEAVQILAAVMRSDDPAAAYRALPQNKRDAADWLAGTFTRQSADLDYADETAIRGGTWENPPLDAFGPSGKEPTCLRRIFTHSRQGLRHPIVSYTSIVRWCHLAGKVYGTPDLRTMGKVHWLYQLHWTFEGDTYTALDVSEDRSRYEGEARGRFSYCLPEARSAEGQCANTLDAQSIIWTPAIVLTSREGDFNDR